MTVPATRIGVVTFPTDARHGRTRHTCPRWLPLPGAEAYEVSATGQVRRATPARGTRVGQILNLRMLQGRHHVDLRPAGGKRLSIYVDEAVCTAFHGPAPTDTAALHVDRNLLNDAADNLRWADPVTVLLEHGRYVDEDGCWNWTGAVSTAGYGRQNHAYVHRISYEHYVGPIPGGMQIDHLCRNRRCFNPQHLEVVTPAINMLRGLAPSAVAVRENRCLNGHPRTPENTYIRPDNGKQMCRECGRRRNQRTEA